MRTGFTKVYNYDGKKIINIWSEHKGTKLLRNDQTEFLNGHLESSKKR